MANELITTRQEGVEGRGALPERVGTEIALAHTPQGEESLVITNPMTGQSVTAHALTADETDAAFTIMGRWDGWCNASAANLRAKWGHDAPENVGIALALAEANPDVAEVAIRHGLNDHPGWIEAAVLLGRRYGVRPGRAGRATTRTEARAMDGMTEGQYEDALREKRKAMNEAIAEGDTKRANRLYQEEMAMVAARDGTRPIVNGRRTA